MDFFLLIFLVIFSQATCWFQKEKNAITSYTDSFKSDVKHGKVLEILNDPQSKISCALKCLRKSFCTTAIIDEEKNVCFLSKMNKVDKEEIEKRASYYSQANGRFSHIQMLGPEVGKQYVPYKDKVFKNCKALKTLHPEARSGIYWIKPAGSNIHKPLQAYCDQETSGGGWTLVWTYAFTDYNNFGSVTNAVTPLPKWKQTHHAPGKVCQPESETTPLSEEQTGAMLFSLWSKIGEEFLIKSNIMNWISCMPNSGSLVKNKKGSIKCRVARNVIGKCGDIVPNMYMLTRGKPECGPRLCTRLRIGPPFKRCSNTYIDFNGDTLQGWPVHDSCGNCKQTQLKGVAMPRGNVFVR